LFFAGGLGDSFRDRCFTAATHRIVLLALIRVGGVLLVAINRLFWRRVYGLPSTRFKLET